MFEPFHFLSPQWLWALPVLLPLLWGLRRSQSDDNAWRGVVDARLLPHLLLKDDGKPQRGPLALLGLGGLIAVLALANPTWERLPSPVFKAQRAVVVALDLSQSMLAADLAPSRLERARYKIVDLLKHNADGQTALIAYAGDAFVVAPLSDDSATVESLLKALEPDLMPLPGSRPDLAISAAQRLLSQAGVAHGEVLLVADDGGDERAIAAAGQLRASGHQLSVLAVGTEDGAPLPGRRGGVQRDAAGKPVVVGLGADSLRALAAAGDGRYATISADDRDLRYLLPPQVQLDATIEQSELSTERWNAMGPWLALLLLPLGALAFRRGWLVAVMAVVITSGGVVTPQPAMAMSWDSVWHGLWQRPDQQSAQALAAGDPQHAAELAEDPQRRGAAQFAAGDFAAADKSFAAAADAADADIDADAPYNRGNALARLGRYKDAIAAYDRALAVEPDMQDALWNKQQIEALLKKQQEQQSQDGKQDSSQQQSQDQQGDKGQQGQQGKQGKQGKQQAGEDSDASEQNQPGQQGQSQQGSKDDQQSRQPQQQAGKDGQQGKQKGQQEQQAHQAQQATHQTGSQQQSQRAEQGEPSDKDGQQHAQAGKQDGEQQPDGDQAKADARQQTAEQQMAQSNADTDGDAGEGEADQAAQADKADAESKLDSEKKLAMEQWLRRIPDDPGGLLRRKFLYQYQRRSSTVGAGSAQPW